MFLSQHLCSSQVLNTNWTELNWTKMTSSKEWKCKAWFLVILQNVIKSAKMLAHCFTIFLDKDEPHRNPNTNNRDHLQYKNVCSYLSICFTLTLANPAWLWDSCPEVRNRKGTEGGLTNPKPKLFVFASESDKSLLFCILMQNTK